MILTYDYSLANKTKSKSKAKDINKKNLNTPLIFNWVFVPRKNYILENNFKKMDEISKLRKNWDGYNSPKIPACLIKEIKNLLYKLPVQPTIYPTGRASVQIQYELSNKSYLEIEFFEKKVLCLMIKNGDFSTAKEFEIKKIDSIEEIVRKFYEKEKTN